MEEWISKVTGPFFKNRFTIFKLNNVFGSFETAVTRNSDKSNIENC